MKLKEWSEKIGIKYLTAYRWFKAGTLPVKAYQTESGTIIVEEELETEKQENKLMNNNVMSVFLKKTVEFSKNNGSIEDFAAWVLANFILKSNDSLDLPKYSRIMPKSEEIQDHFKQFLKPKGEKPKANMFIASDPAAFNDLMAKSDDLTTQELAEEINKINDGVSFDEKEIPEVKDLMKDLSSAISSPTGFYIKNYDEINITGGMVTRSVDLTPQQQLNYTGSDSYASSNDFPLQSTTFSSNSVFYNSPLDTCLSFNSENSAIESNFKLTQKELESLTKVSSEIIEKPKRSRKSYKNLNITVDNNK